MHRAASLLLFSLVAVVHAQQAGTLTTETHPSLTIQQCTSSGCTTLSRSVTLDANWRWVHDSSGTNCYTGNEWDTSICDTPTSCAEDCYLDGADYQGTYGVTSSGDALTLDFVTGSNVGSRLYLLENESTYQTFDLRNQEFTFTVDVSNLPCGLNGALYFSQMYADGGVSEYSNNNAGAKYGAGYCDTQCPQDLKFIGGLANVAGWTPSTNNANTGTGDMGSCCMELDIWEANAYATALTPHVCSNTEPAICTTAEECGNTTVTRYDSYCDHDGCDFNPYRMGNTTFYGEGMTIDTTSPFTVVTQFITSDGTSTGTLSEIRRLYVQNDVVVENSYSDISGMSAYNSITDDYCVAQKTAFGDTDEFETLGGLAQLSEAFEAGMVLVLSLWDDYTVDMLWLDSDYPTDESASDPGVARGPCSTSSGVPATVESDYPSSNVIYSNIKYGDIGTTY